MTTGPGVGQLPDPRSASELSGATLGRYTAEAFEGRPLEAFDPGAW
jgi:hypothetical protein